MYNNGMETSSCLRCGVTIPSKIKRRPGQPRLFCSQKCSAAYRNSLRPKVTHHDCRICGKKIPLGPGQGQKWLCSVKCRRASTAKSARDFHLRQPEKSAIYRNRTKAKRLPDSNLFRFRRNNPDAPTFCQSCGEDRVLDVAHKPDHRRYGAFRTPENCKWPEKVWVLCPTCHALIDRMRYPPEELGLTI